MKSIYIKANTRGVVTYAIGKEEIASFPARLNNYKIPELKEIEKLCK